MTPVDPVPTDPYANKAIVAAVGTIVTVLLRWAVSHEFSVSDEGLVALAGAVTTVAVYAVTNVRRLLGVRSERGVSDVGLLLLLVGVAIGVLLAVFVF